MLAASSCLREHSKGLSSSDSKPVLWSLATYGEITSPMGFYGFIAVSWERHSVQRFDLWLYVNLLIFCTDFLFVWGFVGH